MGSVSVFKALNRSFETYLGDTAAPEQGGARIARLIGPSKSSSIAGGIVIYERITVD